MLLLFSLRSSLAEPIVSSRRTHFLFKAAISFYFVSFTIFLYEEIPHHHCNHFHSPNRSSYTHSFSFQRQDRCKGKRGAEQISECKSQLRQIRSHNRQEFS